MQTPRPHPGANESETLGMGLSWLHFNKPSWWFWALPGRTSPPLTPDATHCPGSATPKMVRVWSADQEIGYYCSCHMALEASKHSQFLYLSCGRPLTNSSEMGTGLWTTTWAESLQICASQIECAYRSPGDPVQGHMWIHCIWEGLGFCTSERPGDAFVTKLTLLWPSLQGSPTPTARKPPPPSLRTPPKAHVQPGLCFRRSLFAGKEQNWVSLTS